MSKIIIVTETGADLSKDFIEQNHIYIVPMHIMIGERNLNDGAFPVGDIFDYYEKTKQIPTTSAPSPDEYRQIFCKAHKENPDSRIIHMCYSAATTSSMQNAKIGSEEMPFVEHLDTKCCSGGQGILIKRTVEYLQKNPEISVADLKVRIQKWISRSRMVFVPGQLEYLRAGGRVSNAAYLGAALLNIKPMIEIRDGQLICGKKYRGSMKTVIEKTLNEFFGKYDCEDGQLAFLYSDGLSRELKNIVEKYAWERGYHNVEWIRTGAAVSVHCGMGTFGICGMLKETEDM